MTTPDTISDNARRIANVLKVRTTRQRLPGRIKEWFHHTLAGAADDKAKNLYSKLLQISQHILPFYKRHFLTCLILLDRLWLVVPGTTCEKDVVRLIKESYHLCDSPGFKAILRDELLDKQWSSFPIVRRIAAEIREIEPVDVAEVNHLADERTFPDIRTAIAKRILLHQQKEHLERLIDYLIWVVQIGGEGDMEERSHAERMFLQLNGFGLPVIVTPIYKVYVQYFEVPEIRGFLMRTLSSLGNGLVPQLEEIYRSGARRQEHRPIIRLLRQMIAFGYPDAARALSNIVITAEGGDLPYAAEQLLAGIKEQAVRGMESVRTEMIRDYSDELVRQLASSDQPSHQRLREQLDNLSWDLAVTPNLVERVVAGTATVEELQRLRLGGRRAVELLSDIIQDECRSARERVAAMKYLSRMYGRRRRGGPETMLWRIYLHAPEDAIRLAALDCLAQLELPPPDPDARQTLFEDYQRGNRESRRIIEQCWNRLFPDVPPPSNT